MADNTQWADDQLDRELKSNANPSRDDVDNDISKSTMSRIFGYGTRGPPDDRLPIDQRQYPSYNVLNDARKYGSGYDTGTDNIIQGHGVVSQTPIRNVPDILNNRGQSFPKPTSVDDAISEQMAQAEAASHKSAVAKLGFDPSRIAVSPNTESSIRLTVSGAYRPSDDQIWYDMQSPTTPTHEAMHRGITQLVKAGQYDKNIDQEEIVRALMSRYFGNAEVGRGPDGNKQIAAARRNVSKKLLDDLEEKAANYYAQRRPGGPR